VRRLAAALAPVAIVALAAAAPGSGRPAAAGKTYAWQTVYAGSYRYTGDTKFKEATGSTEDSQSVVYGWAIIRVDTFRALGRNRFQETVTVLDRSGGAGTLRNTVTRAGQQPMVATAVDCTVVSTGRPISRSRTGDLGVAAKGTQPSALVSWAVPWLTDRTGQYYFDGTPFDQSRSTVVGDAPGVTQHCVDRSLDQRYVVQDGTNLLDVGVETTSGTIAGNYGWFHYDKTSALAWQSHQYPTCGGKELTPDREYFDLWDGSASVPIESLPYSKTFAFDKTISGPMSSPSKIDTQATSATCSDSVHLSSRVAFTQLTCGSTATQTEPAPTAEPTSKPAAGGSGSVQQAAFDAALAPQAACSKVGRLLLEDSIAAMSGQATWFAGGENTTILVPGGPEGGAHATPEVAEDLSVEAQVVPKKGGRWLAATPVTLYRGSVVLKPGAPQLVVMRVTPQGKALLARKHAAIAVTGVVAGRVDGKPVPTERGTFTIPASS
jgi:hypothetical protein